MTFSDSITAIKSWAFYGCSELTDFTLPAALQTIGTAAFQGCTSLTSLIIPDSVTSISTYAFKGCTKLTSLTIPASTSFINEDLSSSNSFPSSNITDLVVTGKGGIPEETFYRFSGLTNLCIGDSITAIGDRAFYICTNLTCVSLGQGLITIGDYAFGGCSALTDVYSLNSTPPSCANAKVFSNATYADATLHVPPGTGAAYASATAWKEFTSIVDDAEVVGIRGVGSDGTGELSFRVISKGVLAVSGVRGTAWLYTLDGKLCSKAQVNGGSATLTAPHSGVYILKTADGAVKIYM